MKFFEHLHRWYQISLRKHVMYSNCHLEHWLFTYSHNCGGGIWLLLSNSNTKHKKPDFHIFNSTLHPQSTMQNKLSISNTFVGGRNYLCDKRYIFELSFGVFVIRIFTELWLVVELVPSNSTTMRNEPKLHPLLSKGISGIWGIQYITAFAYLIVM